MTRAARKIRLGESQLAALAVEMTRFYRTYIAPLEARVAALEKLVEDAATGSGVSRAPGFRAPAETKDEIRLMLAEMADRAAEYILTGSTDDGEDSEEVILTFDDQREIEPGPRLELQVIGWRLVEDPATGSAQP